MLLESPGCSTGPEDREHRCRGLPRAYRAWPLAWPSVVQAWISGVEMHPNSVRQVIKNVSQVFTAAVDDRIIPRNPLAARSVQKPKPLVREVTPWPAGRVEAIASKLPPRLAAIPYLGAACGLRPAAG